MAKISSTVIVRSRREPILVCKKCLKRVPNGHKIKRALKAAMKHQSTAQPKRRPRLVLTGCFDICPKRAVVVANGMTLHRGAYLLLADADQAEDVASSLMQRDRP
jgi:hypothetical protein